MMRRAALVASAVVLVLSACEGGARRTTGVH